MHRSPSLLSSHYVPASSYLAESEAIFPGFSPRTTACVIFCEAEKRLMLVKENADTQPGRWELPGGVFDTRNETASAAALRIFREQAKFEINQDQIRSQGSRFARIAGEDQIIHFFTVDLPTRPDALKKNRWISIYALSILDTPEASKEGRQEAFSVVYHDRLWRRIASTEGENTMIFAKGVERLVFGKDRRLVVSFLGTVACGKATQASLLSNVSGLYKTSVGAIFESEPRETSSLRQIISLFYKEQKNHLLPSEICAGMIARELSRPANIPGCILSDFPSTELECDIYLNSFLRDGDVSLPIFLNIPEDDIRSRIAANDPNAEKRLAKFRENREAVLRKLGSSVKELLLDSRDQPMQVFHRVADCFQTRLDMLLAEQKRSLPPLVITAKMDVANPTEIVKSPFRGNPVMLGLGLAVGVVAGVGIMWLVAKNKA